MQTHTAARGDAEIGTRIVESVAAERDVDPLDLEPPLFEVIDADALDALVRDSSIAVQFQYAGHAVTVRPDGEIDVESAATGEGKRR
jgi:hypothetical protein